MQRATHDDFDLVGLPSALCYIQDVFVQTFSIPILCVCVCYKHHLSK